MNSKGSDTMRKTADPSHAQPKLVRALIISALLAVHAAVGAFGFHGWIMYGVALAVEQVLLFACIFYIMRASSLPSSARPFLCLILYLLLTTSICVHMWSNWTDSVLSQQ